MLIIRVSDRQNDRVLYYTNGGLTPERKHAAQFARTEAAEFAAACIAQNTGMYADVVSNRPLRVFESEA